MHVYDPNTNYTKEILNNFDIIITNFDRIKIENKNSWIWTKHHFKRIILDEGDVIRNKNTKIFSCANNIQVESRWIITGTPFNNSIMDIYSYAKFLKISSYNKEVYFKDNLVKKGKLNMKNIHNFLKDIMIRRTKDSEINGKKILVLPKIVQKLIFIEFPEYEKKKYFNLKKNSNFNQINNEKYNQNITKFQEYGFINEIYSIDKKCQKIEYILNILKERSVNKKTVIFSQFTTFLRKVSKFLPDIYNCEYFAGELSSKQRDLALSKFESDPECTVLLLSLKCGGVGLNITCSNQVIICDPWWNPFLEKQAINRVYRIGQKFNVEVMKLIYKETIEEEIYNVQIQKLELSKKIYEL